MSMLKVSMQGPFYSLHLHYTARPDDPLTQDQDGADRHFMTLSDPVPDVDTAVRLGWFHLGKYGGDYAFLYFEQSKTVLDDEGVWTFEPRYRLTAPDGDNGSITLLEKTNTKD